MITTAAQSRIVRQFGASLPSPRQRKFHEAGAASLLSVHVHGPRALSGTHQHHGDDDDNDHGSHEPDTLLQMLTAPSWRRHGGGPFYPRFTEEHSEAPQEVICPRWHHLLVHRQASRAGTHVLQQDSLLPWWPTSVHLATMLDERWREIFSDLALINYLRGSHKWTKSLQGAFYSGGLDSQWCPY